MSNNDNTADTGENSQNDSNAKTPQNLTEADEIKPTLKRKLDEISERLQSIEASISKMPKIENDEKTAENTENEADSSKNSSNSIESTVPKAMQKSEKRFILKHVFKNVENFVEGKHYESDLENHFNVNSCISLKRLEGHLACYLEIRNPKNETGWSVETKVGLKIDGPQQERKAESFGHLYDRNKGHGFPEFLKWEEMKNEYLIDGNLTVEAQVQIIESSGLGKEKIRKFDESNKDDSDVILVVNKQEFYVLRKFLAAQSSFFKALLLGNFAESKKSKVTLTGIDPDDFHYFLEVLYGELAIDENNVEGILLIADMYDAKTATRRCEDYVVNTSKKSLKKKLQMAVRYNLENLKEKCMEEINTIDQISSVIPSDINDLGLTVMGDLLKKAILLH
ncbi:hypothetical protein B9Z55_007072 [Caenorhabditis nigoni]|uniref:BTB domain-containing protein n=1 Tax=Caenorhabditis nigoni TaxID=1611254 RepID=A0A2G5V7Y3_9PELO|nr:hypothetical protein B9Z55_007072 [Caenorhabditis nigoni]